MDVEAINSVNSDSSTKEALRYQPQQYSYEGESFAPTDGVKTATAQAVTSKGDAKAGEDKNEDPGKKERERMASEASICISLNDEVVHGIPKKGRVVKEGDIISLDAGLIYNNYHSDMARTFPVGKISDEAQKLIDVTRQSFFEGIKFARAGCHLHEISAAIGNYAESFGYGVVRDLTGHGIGTKLHEDPEVPNFACRGRGIRLQSGMTLAIEPMINAGTWEVEWLDDDWTVVTADGALSAHYENTVLITDGDPEILTLSV